MGCGIALKINNAYTVTQYDGNTYKTYNITNYSSFYNYYTSNSTGTSFTRSVDASLKVYDYADLLTSSQESNLYKKINEFIETYNIDMVIVTIDTNNKSSSMAYADDFYDYNDFGIGDNKSGILYLIDMYNREIWISTSGDAIDIYDSYIDTMIDDYCYDYITTEDYYSSSLAFITASSTYYDKYNETQKNLYYLRWILEFVIAIIISVSIPTIFCLYKKSKHKAVKLATDADTYLVKSSFKITDSKDNFLHSNVHKILRSTSSGSGGGGGGSHVGSSGKSHGGGGRRF